MYSLEFNANASVSARLTTENTENTEDTESGRKDILRDRLKVRKDAVVCDSGALDQAFIAFPLSSLWLFPNETHSSKLAWLSLTGDGKKEIVFEGPAAIFAHPQRSLSSIG